MADESAYGFGEDQYSVARDGPGVAASRPQVVYESGDVPQPYAVNAVPGAAAAGYADDSVVYASIPEDNTYTEVNRPPHGQSAPPPVGGAPPSAGAGASISIAAAADAAQSEVHSADFDAFQFSGAFWSPDGNKNWDAGFDELKKYLQQGNDFCRDIISIMSERASIEETYAKSLQKLEAKAAKVGGDCTFGTLKSAWDCVQKENGAMATAHQEISEVLKKKFCEPLTAFKENQKKQHKSCQVKVEKAFKTFTDARSSCLKAKRMVFSKSKQAEKDCHALEEAEKGSGPKVYTDKELSKLRKTAKSAVSTREKSDKAYRDSMTVWMEKQEEWETNMINECKNLQALETDKINELRTLLLEFANTLARTGPELQKTFDDCVRVCESIHAASDCCKISEARGTGQYVAVLPLYDCYEENVRNVMDKRRRQRVLHERLEIWKGELAKKQKTREGLVKLWGASTSLTSMKSKPKGDGGVGAVQRQMVAIDYMLAAAHMNVHKLRCAASDCVGAVKASFSLQQYMHQSEDKGITQSALRMPAAFVLDADGTFVEAQQNAANDSQFAVEDETTVAPAKMLSKKTVQAPEPGAGVTGDQVWRGSGSGASGPPPTGGQPPLPTMPGAGADHTYQVVASNSAPPAHAPPPPPPTGAPPPPTGGDFDEDFDDDDFDDDEEGGDMAPVCRARALYDYAPAEPDELPLTAGQMIEVVDNTDATWWQGRVEGTTNIGVFPASYVETVE